MLLAIITRIGKPDVNVVYGFAEIISNSTQTYHFLTTTMSIRYLTFLYLGAKAGKMNYNKWKKHLKNIFRGVQAL
jgi:hypothetical protein